MQKHLSQVRTEAEHRLPTVVEDLEPTGFRRLRTRRPWVTLKNSLYNSLFRHLNDYIIHSNSFPRPGDPISYTHTLALEGYNTGDHW